MSSPREGPQNKLRSRRGKGLRKKEGQKKHWVEQKKLNYYYSNVGQGGGNGLIRWDGVEVTVRWGRGSGNRARAGSLQVGGRPHGLNGFLNMGGAVLSRVYRKREAKKGGASAGLKYSKYLSRESVGGKRHV